MKTFIYWFIILLLFITIYDVESRLDKAEAQIGQFQMNKPQFWKLQAEVVSMDEYMNGQQLQIQQLQDHVRALEQKYSK